MVWSVCRVSLLRISRGAMRRERELMIFVIFSGFLFVVLES